jgi:hypothetical protein
MGSLESQMEELRKTAANITEMAKGIQGIDIKEAMNMLRTEEKYKTLYGGMPCTVDIKTDKTIVLKFDNPEDFATFINECKINASCRA